MDNSHSSKCVQYSYIACVLQQNTSLYTRDFLPRLTTAKCNIANHGTLDLRFIRWQLFLYKMLMKVNLKLLGFSVSLSLSRSLSLSLSRSLARSLFRQLLILGLHSVLTACTLHCLKRNSLKSKVQIKLLNKILTECIFAISNLLSNTIISCHVVHIIHIAFQWGFLL